MKLNLLLLFTICSMVSFAQSKTVAAPNQLTLTTQNETTNYNDSVKIYPTVTVGLVYFAVADESLEYTITVFDIYGKEHKVEMNKGTMDLSHLKSGMYIIQFHCKLFTTTKNVLKK